MGLGQAGEGVKYYTRNGQIAEMGEQQPLKESRNRVGESHHQLVLVQNCHSHCLSAYFFNNPVRLAQGA